MEKTQNHEAQNALATTNLRSQISMVKALKDCRAAAGLSIEEVAERCGTGTNEVLDLEQVGEASGSFLRRYASAVGAVIEFSVIPARTAG